MWLSYAAYENLEAPPSQFWGPTMVAGAPGVPDVALTFDDGPNPPYTDRILDVLAAERVHATFFVVGRAVDAHPATVKRIVAEGHAIGNHTWDHPHLILDSPAAVRSELARTDAAVFAAAGVHMSLMRPPFGARDFAVIDQARRAGYRVVMWSDPLPEDWAQPGAATIAARVLEHVHDGSIIVLHDGNRGRACGSADRAACDRSQDVEATRAIIAALRARGFRFVTIPELFAAHA